MELNRRIELKEIFTEPADSCSFLSCTETVQRQFRALSCIADCGEVTVLKRWWETQTEVKDEHEAGCS